MNIVNMRSKALSAFTRFSGACRCYISLGTQLRVIGLFIASDVTFTAVQNETLTEYALVFQH